MIFLTSDTHFGHKNICKLANRPFASVQEMDDYLVVNWNNRVGPADTVYHLGDFCFGPKPADIIAMRKRLNGQIFLLKGNHDNDVAKYKEAFGWVKDYHMLKHEGLHIALMHYPLMVWDRSHHGTFHAHGHCHNSLPVDPRARRMDVGVDAVAAMYGGTAEDYRPFSIDEFLGVMRTRQFEPVDHHDGTRG